MSVHRLQPRSPQGTATEILRDHLPALIEALAQFLADRLAPILAERLGDAGPATQGGDLVKAAEAAALLGMTEDWVRRHGEREGFAVRVGRRAIRYSRRAIARYHRAQAGAR